MEHRAESGRRRKNQKNWKLGSCEKRKVGAKSIEQRTGLRDWVLIIKEKLKIIKAWMDKNEFFACVHDGTKMGCFAWSEKRDRGSSRILTLRQPRSGGIMVAEDSNK